MHFRGITLTALLCCLAFPALAKEPLIPPRDPLDHPRVIRLTNQDSTSRCIGHPVTPACAIEQVLAATLRGDAKLWKAAMIKGAQPYDWTQQGIPFGDFVYYRYVGGKRLGGDKVADWGMRWEEFGCLDMMHAARKGDLRIDVQHEYNTTGTYIHQIKEETAPTFFIVRHISHNEWRIVDYCPPRIEDERDMFWLDIPTSHQ